MMKWLLQQAAELPAFAQVLQQRLALELNENVDGVDPRIHQIAENEINNSILSSKGNGGLGAFLGQRVEPRAFSPGEHKSEYF